MRPACWLPRTLNRPKTSARHMAGSGLAEVDCARNFGARAALVMDNGETAGSRQILDCTSLYSEFLYSVVYAYNDKYSPRV